MTQSPLFFAKHRMNNFVGLCFLALFSALVSSLHASPLIQTSAEAFLQSVNQDSNNLFTTSFASTSLQKSFGVSRKLTQAQSQSRCSWNSDSSTCEVSRPAIAQFLSSSNSILAEFTSRILICQLHPTEEECLQGLCSWSDGECGPGPDVFGNASTAGCFGEASVFLLSDQHDLECLTHQSSADCSEDNSCSWSIPAERCVFDLVKSLTGIPTEGSQPEGFDEVLSKLTERMTIEFRNSFNMTENLINWEEVLEWTVPTTDCPEGVAQTVCDFADPFLQLFPTTLYCRGKYPEGGDVERCSRDERCEASWASCDTSSSLLRDARLAAYRVFVDSIEDSLVREIMNQTFTCSTTASKKLCRGFCEWDEMDGSCQMSTAWLNRKLGEKTSARGEPACRYVAAVFQSGCMAQDSERRCKSVRQCEWDPIDETCGPGEAVFRELVLSDSPSLRRQYNRMAKRCERVIEVQSCEDV